MQTLYQNGPLKVEQYPSGMVRLTITYVDVPTHVDLSVEQAMEMTAKITSAVFPFQKRGG